MISVQKEVLVRAQIKAFFNEILKFKKKKGGIYLMFNL